MSVVLGLLLPEGEAGNSGKLNTHADPSQVISNRHWLQRTQHMNHRVCACDCHAAVWGQQTSARRFPLKDPSVRVYKRPFQSGPLSDTPALPEPSPGSQHSQAFSPSSPIGARHPRPVGFMRRGAMARQKPVLRWPAKEAGH